MITLSLLRQMELDSLGTIDSDLWHLEVPLDANGVPRNGLWVLPRGTTVSRYNVNIQAVDIYVRNNNKNTALKKANQVLHYLKDSYSDVCELPSYPPIFSTTYSNVIIEPTSGVDFLGVDENKKFIFVVSGEIRYQED